MVRRDMPVSFAARSVVGNFSSRWSSGRDIYCSNKSSLGLSITSFELLFIREFPFVGLKRFRSKDHSNANSLAGVAESYGGYTDTLCHHLSMMTGANTPRTYPV